MAVFAMLVAASLPAADPVPFAEEVRRWQAAREKKLRAENGWLSLAGRFLLKDGDNTIGVDKNNDVVFPDALKGTVPARLGVVHVDGKAKKVVLKLPKGVTMLSDGKPFDGDRMLGTATDVRDWVSLGRSAFHVIERNGKYFLRLADNESAVRKDFAGCVWYAPDEAFKVEAKYIPYLEKKTLSIVNVIDEVSKQPCPGYVEFRLKGQVHRIDAVQEGKGLFLIFRDETAGDTTYGAGRFIDIEEMPKANESFTLDFNKAYNPPCAFSQFTTCPLPPKQNILKTRIEAGEKYRDKR